MCINKLLALFKKKDLPAPTPTMGIVPEKPAEEIPASLPHPEEPPDYSRTMANADLDAALDNWTLVYNIPKNQYSFWKTKIAMTLDDTLPYPAATYEQDGIRHLTIRPEWVNPGVIAHEQAHNSYALLTERQKDDFSAVYTPLKTTHPLIVLLYTKNTYGLTNDIEGHAEVYRYLGEKMPAELKQYYPKLFT